MRIVARSQLLLLLVAAMFVLVAACSDEGDAEEPTPAIPTDLPQDDDTDISDDFTGSSPPALTVTSGDMSVQAGLGTFCYDRLCADAIGYITPVEALPGDSDLLQASLTSDIVTEVSVSASPSGDLDSQPVCTVVDGIEPKGPICEDGRELLAWTGAPGEGIVLPATVDGGTVAADLAELSPGSYVVSFFLRFESGGDASYGVLLDVSG